MKKIKSHCKCFDTKKEFSCSLDVSGGKGVILLLYVYGILHIFLTNQYGVV